MDQLKQERLMSEYHANVELWKHHDILRQARSGNFLNVNTILVVALGAVLALKTEALYLGLVGFLFSIFGLIICVVWHKIQRRGSEYVRFQRYQLFNIECQLPEVKTFKNIYKFFYQYQAVEFCEPIGEVRIDEKCKSSSTKSENLLAYIVGSFWGLIGVVALVMILVTNCLSQ